jgi:hypothetical protein
VFVHATKGSSPKTLNKQIFMKAALLDCFVSSLQKTFFVCSKKFRFIRAFLVKSKLPLPWDNNKHLHRQIVRKHEAFHAKKRRELHVQYMRNITMMPPAQQKAMFDSIKCYGCKSVMGMVGKEVPNLKSAGREILVNAIKVRLKFKK